MESDSRQVGVEKRGQKMGGRLEKFKAGFYVSSSLICRQFLFAENRKPVFSSARSREYRPKIRHCAKIGYVSCGNLINFAKSRGGTLVDNRNKSIIR